MDTEPERTFLAEIAARPACEVLRLVYADWLEEQGDPRFALFHWQRKAAELRPQLRLRRRRKHIRPQLDDIQQALGELSRIASRRWAAIVTATEIHRCPLPAQCLGRWEKLDPTDNEQVRHCRQCQQSVCFLSDLADISIAAGRDGPVAAAHDLAADVPHWRNLVRPERPAPPAIAPVNPFVLPPREPRPFVQSRRRRRKRTLNSRTF